MKRSPIKRKKPMRRCHPETEKNLRAYYIFKPIWVRANPFCAVQGCLNPTSEPHHMKRRGHRGKYLCREEWLMPVCREHHDWIETHKNAARDMGFILY
jgi:hypothetical protein